MSRPTINEIFQESTIETIPIFFRPLSLSRLPDRISLSNGTVEATTYCLSKPYVEGARIPDSDFVTLSDGKCGKKWVSRDLSVGLLKLFDVPEVLQLQSQLKLLQLQHEAYEVTSADAFVGYLLERIRENCRLQGPIHFHRLTFDEPNLLTTSQDPSIGKFVGLHVDTWDDGGTGISGNRNRICINFGPEDRFFLFVDLSLPQMRKILETLEGTSLARLPQAQVGRRFMTEFSNYPVTRLRIRPGEAYVAPTCEILHDASTIGTSQRVMHTALRAYVDF